MIRHQNADAMVLANWCAYERHFPPGRGPFWILSGGWMPLISALAIRPWRQHFDGELRLRQNHRKTKKSGICIVSILCQNFDVSRVEKLIAWIGKVSPCCRLYICVHCRPPFGFYQQKNTPLTFWSNLKPGVHACIYRLRWGAEEGALCPAPPAQKRPPKQQRPARSSSYKIA